jgi:branched-chain amino acid transport system substrate-binding protein
MTEGAQLGKYRILDELGSGGFATVYKAVDTTLDREVALKILHPPLLADRRFVQSFRQEARTLAALRHPQIITIYEVGEIEGRLFIAMDLARGASLANEVANRGRIPWNETLALLKPICDALDYAHEQGVVHRDLKPANILIGKRRGALLTDFGFAKLLAENPASMTMSGGIVGTPGYMAPEVWESNAADPPVDIYALGCIVYEMLTGDVLFKGQTPIQAMRAHDRGPQLPSEWPEGVPSGTAEVLAKALARDSAERYASAGALWQALNELDAQAQAARETARLAELARQEASRREEESRLSEELIAQPNVEASIRVPSSEQTYHSEGNRNASTPGYLAPAKQSRRTLGVIRAIILILALTAIVSVSILLLLGDMVGPVFSSIYSGLTRTDSTSPSNSVAGGTSNTITIVSSLPRQGASKGQTDAVVNAIKMRFEEDNYQVCNDKFTINYQDLDDATAAKGSWDEATEMANANNVVSNPDAMIYLGPLNSGAAKLSIPILNTSGMVMISPTNTYTGLTKPGKGEAGEPDKYYPTGKRNYTRMVAADDVQGDAAAKWAQKLGVKKVYILDDQQVYGKGVADMFEATSKTIGLEVLGHEGIDPKAQNYTSLMTKIKDLGPDMVYFGGIVDNNAGQLLKDMRAVGMASDAVKFMGPDGIETQSFIDGVGAIVAEGTYTTIAGLPQLRLGQKGQDFYKRYKEKFRIEAQSFGIYGYEAANVAMAALNQVCKKDRAAIRDAVLATKDFDGVLGKWSFDQNGDTTLNSVTGYQVKNGQWQAVDVYTNGAWEN